MEGDSYQTCQRIQTKFLPICNSGHTYRLKNEASLRHSWKGKIHIFICTEHFGESVTTEKNPFVSQEINTDLVGGEQDIKVLSLCFPVKLSPSLFVSFVAQHSQRRREAATEKKQSICIWNTLWSHKKHRPHTCWALGVKPHMIILLNYQMHNMLCRIS